MDSFDSGIFSECDKFVTLMPYKRDLRRDISLRSTSGTPQYFLRRCSICKVKHSIETMVYYSEGGTDVNAVNYYAATLMACSACSAAHLKVVRNDRITRFVLNTETPVETQQPALNTEILTSILTETPPIATSYINAH